MDNTEVADALFAFLFGMTPQDLDAQMLDLSDLASCNVVDVLSKLETLATLAKIEIEDVRKWIAQAREERA